MNERDYPAQLSLRIAAAANESTSALLLSHFAADISQQVRLCVSSNPATPNHVLKQLSTDDEPGAGYRAPEIKLPTDILVALRAHSNGYIRKQAELTLCGLKLENCLTENLHRNVTGTACRLGELLISAQLVNAQEIKSALFFCCLFGIPLGRCLLQSGHISPDCLIAALVTQSNIRRGNIHAEAGALYLAETCK
ncbi:MAG: hypothetical protein KGS72_26475 [Cyanobacteria bacterium REEB67]|nr:hypothetical protein [Cyanobacteria bacterium REEB67]